MKYLLFILLIVAAALLISCEKDEGVTSPDMTEDGWLEEGPYALMLWTAPEARHQQELMVVTREFCNFIKINNIQLEVQGFYKEGDYYYNEIDYHATGNELLVQPGATCNYLINVGSNKNYSGVFDTPVSVSPTFPAFNPILDYIPQWTSDVNPWNYLINWVIQDSLMNGVYDQRQIAGSSENISIPKATWADLHGVESFELYLNAVNYKRASNDGLAVGIYETDYHWFVAKGAAPKTDTSVKALKLMQKILKGDIRFD